MQLYHFMTGAIGSYLCYQGIALRDPGGPLQYHFVMIPLFNHYIEMWQKEGKAATDTLRIYIIAWFDILIMYYGKECDVPHLCPCPAYDI